jgi:two-component system cell cycle response regulator
MNAVVIILGLTGAVFSLSASLQWMGMKTVLGVDYRVAVSTLVILVLAFAAQTIYQHVKARRLQRELEEQHVQAEVFRRLAMFDALTGLYNRRFAEQRLKAEIARSERRGHPLIVVLVDLNDFKEINNEYGHQAGDLVLRIRQALEPFDEGDRTWRRAGWRRIHDAAGGLRGGAIVACTGAAGSVRQVNGKTLPISVAAGWKAYEPGDRVEELIEAADRRLYYNKEIVKRREPAVVAKV